MIPEGEFTVSFNDQNDGGIMDETWPFPDLIVAERFARFILDYAPGLYCYITSTERDEDDEPVWELAIYAAGEKIRSLNRRELP